MPLLIPMLKQSLLEQWLEPDSFPASTAESGQRFASAVASWFSLGMAGPFPCSTALARQGQLGTAAAAALAAGAPPSAGSQLSMAVSSYYSGQLFGAGTAGFPAASGAVAPLMGAVFSDLTANAEQRAERIATACQLLALSTLVVFPPPLPSFPVF